MSKNKASCFISYCHEDTNKIDIQKLVEWLDELSESEINFEWDIRQETGARLDFFMDKIYTSDAVMILLSPAYKKKINGRVGGVYDEFQRIMNRIEEFEFLQKKHNKSKKEKQKLLNNKFSVFPYMFSGDHDKSCPDVLLQRKYESLIDWRTYRNNSGKYYVSERIKKLYRSEFHKVISIIHHNYHTSKPEFSKLFYELQDKLFKTTKQEDSQAYLDQDPDIAQHLFVKTIAYTEVKHQYAYILTGRKGTGKTTLTEYIPKMQKSKYKQHIPVKIDKFELETISELLSKPQVYSDTRHVIRRERVFRLAWELFIYVHCMEVIIQESKNGNLAQSQEDASKYIKEYFNEEFQYDTEIHLSQIAVYKWAIEKIIKTINDSIKNARTGDKARFYFDIEKNLTDTNIIESVFNLDLLYPFSQILKKCSRRFFFSVDGFDRNFDEFRRNAKRRELSKEDVSKMVLFENDWVRSLIFKCREMKSDVGKWKLGEYIDFCVTIPKDRCIEIMLDERDTVAYSGRILEMKWTGIELVVMLRKRLEILFDHYTDIENNAIERLDEVLDVCMEHLLKKNITKVGKNEFIVHIFIDVLRHSFWRPRDILSYLTLIITTYFYLKKRNVKINSFLINKIISDNTYSVINKEFISEFNTVLANIEEIIKLFKGKKQIMNFSEFQDIIANFSFEFSNSLISKKDFIRNTKFLFDIGFIGLRCNDDIVERFKLITHDIFSFNDSGKLVHIIKDGSWKECEIVIHPIFCEYLNLNTENQDLVLNYSWEYLVQQEALEYSAYTH